MKSFRKLFAVLMVAALCLALALPAFADDSYTITINTSEQGHTYEAYQIFAGDLSIEGEGDSAVKTLSNITWGSGVDTTALPEDYADAAAVAESLTDDTAAKAFAKEIGQVVTDSIGLTVETADGNATYVYLTAPAATSTGNGPYTIAVTEPGYYLVKDEYNSLDGVNAKNMAYTSYILQVVGDATATPKATIPTVEKKVVDDEVITDETDYADLAENAAWDDSADYSVGDGVPFQLTAKLGSDISDYDTYFISFEDTLSGALDYNGDVKVFLDGTDVTESFTVTYNPPLAGAEQNVERALTITCGDVLALGATGGSEIVAVYTATLNENAVIGTPGNPNSVVLTYSNNPNETSYGETNPDVVIVFTYETVVNKVSGDLQPLAGAEFTLYKFVGTDVEGADEDGYIDTGLTAAVNEESQDEAGNVTPAGTTFAFQGLDAGQYKLVESTTPAGYNTADPIVFEIKATHGLTADNVGTLTVDDIENFTVTNGSVETDVINNQGTSLPETGGTGTTIFYVVGAILVIGAGVILIARKRAGRA
jgi:fimbrial isopeptide formation D2 family protein/LPXTG-motif cell wall-anchored protein